MTRESKTPKGAMQEARKRHLNRQAASAALKKLREGLKVDVTAFGPDRKLATFRVRPLKVEGDLNTWEPFPSQLVLCVCGGRLRVMHYVWKDGYNVADNCKAVRLPEEQIYGIVEPSVVSTAR